MTEEQNQNPQTDNGPDQIERPAQYPTATRVENGVAYDQSGKALGSVSGQAAQSKGDDFFASLGGKPVQAQQETKGDDFFASLGGKTVAPQQEPDKPGYFQRLGESVGITKEGLEAEGKEFTEHPIRNALRQGTYGPLADTVQGVYGWGKRAATNIYEGGKEELEAARNIGEGGPIVPNLGKAASGIVHGGVGSLPFVGEPIETAAQDIVNKNYGGAAGGLTGVAAQVLLERAGHKTEGLTDVKARHESAKAVFDTRLQEVGTATDNAKLAAQQAEQATHDAADGKIPHQQAIEAQDRASAAAANAKKAHDALREAGEIRAEAAVQVDKLTREAQAKTNKLSGKQMKAAAAAEEDFRKVAPPTASGPAAYTNKDYQVGRRYLEEHHQNIEQIGSKQGLYDALDHTQKDIENQVKPYVEKYGNEPITSDPMMDVRDALADSPRADFIEKGMNHILETYPQIEDGNLTVAESEKIGADLNAANRAALQKNWGDVATALKADPEFAARYALADSLRNGRYDLFEEKDVQGIREIRQDEASIIRLRNAVQRGITKGDTKVRGSGESGRFRQAAAWATQKGSTAIGAKLAGPKGAVLGEMGGERLGRIIAPGDLTQDQLVQRMMKVRGGGVPTTDIVGPGMPSTAQPRGLALSPRDMQLVMREHSPLHSDLATHYGESVGDSNYGQLEQRFMNDIADKQQHGVSLESSEKQLLKQINQANAADLVKQREAAQQEAVSGKKIGTYNLPDRVEPVLEVNRKLPNGMNTREALVHDLAHIVVGSELGLDFEDGIRSHLHAENKGSGRVMTAPINWEPFTDEEGNIDFNKLAKSLPDIASTYVAGGVANDLFHEVPFTENHSLGADMSVLKSFMKKAGFSEAEASKLIAQAAENAATILSRPGTREILEGHASLREAGLSEKYHFSPERVEQVLQDLKEGTKNEGTARKSARTSGERPGAASESGAGTEGQAEDKSSKVVSKEGKGSSEAKEGRTRAVTESANGTAGASGTAESNNPAVSTSLGSMEDEDFGYMRPDGTLAMSDRFSALGEAGGTHDDLARVNGEKMDDILGTPGGVKYGMGKKGGFLRISNSEPKTIQHALKVIDGLPTDHIDFDYTPPKGEGQYLYFEGTPKEVSGKIRRGLTGSQVHDLGEVNPAFSTAVAEPKDAIEKEGLKYKGELVKGSGVHMFEHPDHPGKTAALQEPFTQDEVRSKMQSKLKDFGVNADKSVSQHADEFNRSQGRSSIDSATKPHSTEFAKRVADAYDQLKHEPNNPAVKKAYDAMKSDVDKQWDYATQQMGMKLEPWAKEGQPYANSKEMVQDVKNNKHLYFFSGGDIPADHPLAGIDPKTGLAYNDKFRAVHDLFGHAAQGNQFGPKGEETAYQLHRQMFSPEAVPALTSETRGQNSWVNFGNHLRDTEGNIPEKGQPGFVPQTERPYAEQKAGVLPDQFHAAVPEVKPDNPAFTASTATEPQTTSDKLVEKYGTTDDPHKAGFILSDGRMVPLSGEHDSMLKAVHSDQITDRGYSGPLRHTFINNENAVRTRLRTGRGGKEVVFSVPKDGVSPEQIEQINKSVGQLRNGNVVMEVGDDGHGASTKKEFARVSDVEPMLREIGALPKESLNPAFAAKKIIGARAEALDKIKKIEQNRSTEPAENGHDSLWENWDKAQPFTAHKDGFLNIGDTHEAAFAQHHFNGNIPEDFEDWEKLGGDDTHARGWAAKDGSKMFLWDDLRDMLKEKDNPDAKWPALKNALLELQNRGMAKPETQLWDKGGDDYLGTLNELGLHKQNTTPENPAFAVKGSSVPLMENPLKVTSTGDQGRITTIDVAKELKKFTKKSLPALEQGEANPEAQVNRAKKLAEDEAKYQLNQANSGKAWYTTDIADHDKILKELRPELTDPAKLSVFKMAEAVLSSGQKPYSNLKSAIKAWDYYNETGEFSPMNPDTKMSWGPRNAAAYGNALQMINRLTQEQGEKGASDWLLSEHPVKELRTYNRDVKGKMDDPRLGATILGEKRGPFAQNLHGIESAFTADMWVNRTWNRWMGTQEINPDGELRDSPRNMSERNLMKQSFEETANKLSLTTSSLQAVLWYYEQSLYGAHGVPKESWNFADAARRIQKEQLEQESPAQGGLFEEQRPRIEPTHGGIHAFDFLRSLGGAR